MWLEVFRKLGKLQSPEAFRVWLYRIAHDRAVTAIRREVFEAEACERAANATTEAEPTNELEWLENAELIHMALERLSPVHREVMTLRYLEEMDVREIARVMQCSEGTAKSRLHYAKAALRQIIEKEQGRA